MLYLELFWSGFGKFAHKSAISEPNSWMFPTLTFLAGLAGGIFGGYLSKWGEIRAVHKQLDDVIKDTREIREATARVEATVSLELWDKQKRWEVRKEALFDVINELANISYALTRLTSSHESAKQYGQPNNAFWLQQKTEAITNWTKASLSYDRAILLAMLVSGAESRPLLSLVNTLMGRAGKDVVNNDLDHLSKIEPQIVSGVKSLIEIFRKELRLEDAV